MEKILGKKFQYYHKTMEYLCYSPILSFSAGYLLSAGSAQ